VQDVLLEQLWQFEGHVITHFPLTRLYPVLQAVQVVNELHAEQPVVHIVQLPEDK